MSLITRCPACGTQFRVVPDQLKISDGWVRCGQCGDVFDAQALLVGAAAPLAPLAEPQFPEPQFTQPQAEPHGFVDTTVGEEPEYQPPPLYPPVHDLPEPVGHLAPEPDLQWTTPLEPTAAAADESVPDSPPESQPGPGEEPGQPPEISPAPEPAPEPSPGPAQEPVLDDVSFVRQARRRAFWRRPLVRVGLGLLACVLGLVLAVQVVIQQRDTLAQQSPGLRPLLEALCQPLGCRVGPPRRIEAVAIDNSNFSRLRPDAYKLSVTVANQSPTAVAMPALELTLTDSQDQPILRRVIAPDELGRGGTTVIGANAEWSATLTVAVTPNATTARIVGYRLLAFYP